MNPFVGTWTYRSFHDKPEEVDDFNKIRLWQASLSIEPDGDHLVKGSIGTGSYWLDIRGAVDVNAGQPVIRLRATGRPGSQTEGWIYDYVGTLAPDWKDGDSQRPAIVGTVIRTVPHSPDRRAGQSYSFVAVNTSVPPVQYQLPASVVSHYADRMHRLHHAVWHGIRNNWNDLAVEEQQRLKDLDWQITGDRTALKTGRERTRPMVMNGSGEDFLFFHRQMVVHYRALMSSAGEKPIEWIEIPQPGSGGDSSPNAVPESWSIPGVPHFERRLQSVKTDSFYWSRMRWWDYQFKDPTYLAQLTLGELGALIEFSVHNDMHIRWSRAPRDPVTNGLLPLGRPDHEIDSKWDDAHYDWLGEFYSSHVNPVFWRLHGWIDDRIDDWYAAHESKHAGQVKPVEKGGVAWFATGRWVQVEEPWVWPNSLGGNHHGHGHVSPEDRDKRIKSAEKVMAILFPPPPATPTVMLGGSGVRRSPRTSIVGLD